MLGFLVVIFFTMLLSIIIAIIKIMVDHDNKIHWYDDYDDYDDYDHND